MTTKKTQKAARHQRIEMHMIRLKTRLDLCMETTRPNRDWDFFGKRLTRLHEEWDRNILAHVQPR